MFVRKRMTSPATTISPDMQFQDALHIMRENGYRRLPIVDGQNRLVGIVSERDLLHASPSPATSLSVWEMNYLLSKLKVSELMTKKVITVTSDMAIEAAAARMIESGVGGMPVVDRENHVIGVITETDIFKALVEMMGGNEPGLRLELQVDPGKGTLAKLATAITKLDGNIVSVGTFGVDETGAASLVVKVQGVSEDQLVETLEALGDHVVDVREV